MIGTFFIGIQSEVAKQERSFGNIIYIQKINQQVIQIPGTARHIKKRIIAFTISP